MPSTRPPLALVHGWGMNARVFDALAALLAPDFDVVALDLPGHGGRAPLAVNDLDAWSHDLAVRLAPGTTLLGWSLGGQVALRAALDHPERVSRLILLASTPRFVAEDGWPHGMASADLEAFGASLLADPQATLLRFLSLQTRGGAGQKALLQHLRETLLAQPTPHPAALEAGLAILRDADLRAAAASLAQPVLVLHGALDTLTPAGAGAWLAQNLPRAAHVEFERAAHAPQLSHPDEVAGAIQRFCHG